MTSEVEIGTVLAAKQAWTSSYHTVYFTGMAFGFVALIAACFMRSTDVRKKTTGRAVQLESEKAAVEKTKNQIDV